MLFNSFEFIFLFLPFAVFGYFFLNSRKLVLAGELFLMGCSLFFYGYWNPIYLPLIFASVAIDYTIGRMFHLEMFKNIIRRKALLVFAITLDLGILGFFKYTDFGISNLNYVAGASIPLMHIALPLGVSFFTFEQIAYIVDNYKGQTEKYSFVNYATFVTFFPHLIAGPIQYHHDIVPQLHKTRNKILNAKNLSKGLFVFIIGLFKKVMIADTFAQWAAYGYDKAINLTLIEAWITSLSYTFQIYFDFSGYCDMAIGAALMLNITMPINFNSPYKSLSITEFWRRWHMTLSRFLKEYLYVPMGGNRSGFRLACLNAFIVFCIGGLWHGAKWTFVFWGVLHGSAIVVHRLWSATNRKLNPVLAWLITFNFVNITWVFFRALTWQDAIKVLKGMLNPGGLVLPQVFHTKFPVLGEMGFRFLLTDAGSFSSGFEFAKVAVLILVVFSVILMTKNSVELLERFEPSQVNVIILLVLTWISVMHLESATEFLYFNF